MRLRVFWCLKCGKEQSRHGDINTQRKPIIYPIICKPCESEIQKAMKAKATEIGRELKQRKEESHEQSNTTQS